MSDAAAPVLVEDRGPVRWLILNRPEARNAQSIAMLEALADALVATAADRSVRAVVLAGNGPSFSAGHDLKEAVSNPTYRENIGSVEGRLWQELDYFVRPVDLLRDLRVPTICRVQGHCIAAAIMLAAAADLVIAADDALFYSAVTRDMAADDVEVPALAWAVGERRARQLLWTSERFGAEQAERFGLVNWVVPRAELDAKVEEVVAQVLEVPSQTLALSKMSLRFMEDRRGRSDSAAFHFLSHQISHNTTDAKSLLQQRFDAAGIEDGRSQGGDR
ncbi:MAG TPA: enoyl-CoA hydratase-related protein [Solirubrobacterales bacterium]|nr:enoyl-CoA hydratase-related protein [Solirubrobacterales bacterium]